MLFTLFQIGVASMGSPCRFSAYRKTDSKSGGNYPEIVLLYPILNVAPAGFEPAPPKRTDLKSVALDHSAIESSFIGTGIYILFNKIKRISL